VSETSGSSTFGPNAWLVDEMYDQYRQDPGSVSESWQEFFADYRKDGVHGSGDAAESAEASPAASNGNGTAAAPPAAAPAPPPAAPAPAAATSTPAPAPASAPSAIPAESPAAAPAAAAPAAPAPAAAPEPATPGAEPLRGAAARIVSNMEASLGVPTATSFRVVPAKLLEVNRKVINGYLGRTRGGKVSFTHLIGYAIVQALKAMPVMNAAYAEIDGKPGVIRHPHVGMGLAVDVEKSDGSRTLLVPCIKEADTLDFAAFLAAYEDLIRKVKSNKIGVDDFAGTTMSLTNPGTIGTVQSVPRLMPGQGLIVGVGSIDHPAEFQAADPRTLADLGLSKVVTVTSTYDHRIIQGAESGLFLKKVHELLTGGDDFYDRVFASLGVPYEAVELRRDVNPVDRESAMIQKQMQVDTVINMHRVRGPPDRRPRPAAVEGAAHAHRARPGDLRADGVGPRPEFFTGGPGRPGPHAARRHPRVLRDAYCRTIGVEYMHIQDPEQKRWIQDHVEGVKQELDDDEQRHILGRLNAAEAFEKFLATKYVGASASASRARVDDPDARRRARRRRRRRARRCGHGHGPPGTAQRAVQHRGQEPPADLPGVRGCDRRGDGPGLG
jgi:2-oxoglutarate dehydrogenase E1 component